jgi:hypothetical protein
MMHATTPVGVEDGTSELIRKIEFGVSQWKQVGGCRRSKRVRRTVLLLEEGAEGLSYGSIGRRGGSGGTLESSAGAGPSIDSMVSNSVSRLGLQNACRARSCCSWTSRSMSCSRRRSWRSVRSRKSRYFRCRSLLEEPRCCLLSVVVGGMPMTVMSPCCEFIRGDCRICSVLLRDDAAHYTEEGREAAPERSWTADRCQDRGKPEPVDQWSRSGERTTSLALAVVGRSSTARPAPEREASARMHGELDRIERARYQAPEADRYGSVVDREGRLDG